MGIFGKKKSEPEEYISTVTHTGAVSLTKGGKTSISLVKGRQITATLEWDGGSVFRRSKGADLELYALYVLRNGQTGLVYWNHLIDNGIKHHGDSLVPGVETVTVTDPSLFESVLIVAYSAISNGPGSFKSYGATAVVTDGEQTVVVPLYDNNESYWVAIAQVDFKDSNIDIRSVETYSRPGSEARPAIYSDGSFKMDAGPIEFKNY